MDKEILKKIMISAAGAFVAVSGGLLGTAALAAVMIIGGLTDGCKK